MYQVEFTILGQKVIKSTNIKNKEEFREEALKKRTESEKIAESILRKHLTIIDLEVEYLFQFRRFDFYIHKLKTAIEIDGGYHASEYQKAYDIEVDKYLKEKHGIETIRIKNEDVKSKTNNIAKDLAFRLRIKKDEEHKKIAIKENLNFKNKKLSKKQKSRLNKWKRIMEYRALVAIANKPKPIKTILRKAYF